MLTIADTTFGGERPLFNRHDLCLRNVVIEPGESALKECSVIEAYNCEFKGKYPFWHVDTFKIKDCVFRPTARAALWYSRRLLMEDTLIEAPKMFRRMSDLTLRNIRIPDAAETLWDCVRIVIRHAQLKNGDYLGLNSRGMDIEELQLEGNYAFQNCRDVTIRNSVLISKDAFWEAENVTVSDSILDGEYLGWHSRNLHLINCRISGTQPLCYAENLTMERCSLAPDCDLAFEYSTGLAVSLDSPVTSVKNPASGAIFARAIGELILDGNRRENASCRIRTGDGRHDL